MTLRLPGRILLGSVVSALVCLPAVAAPVQAAVSVVRTDPTAPPKKVSIEEFLRQIDRERSALQVCEANVQACDRSLVGEDVQVTGSANGDFIARWYWMRDALEAAKTATGGDREKLFRNARQRLNDEAAQLEQPAAPVANNDVRDAAAKADEILARGEFRHFQENSFLWVKIAALIALLERLYSGAFRALPTSTAFGAFLEWAVVIGAGMALMLWVWRANRQQRIMIATERAPVQAWQQESEQWAERAQAEAARANWREAVHCLYWSAIVMLEGQRFWRQNRARTPREYVALLEPGSPKRQSLSGLTRVFERIWYGLRPAAQSDFDQAQSLLNELRGG
jgi:hypothetical protein